MNGLKMSSKLVNSGTYTSAIYSNQTMTTDANDNEVLYYSNGEATSSDALAFDGNKLDVTGDVVITNGGLAQGAPGASERLAMDANNAVLVYEGSGSYLEMASVPILNSTYIDFHSKADAEVDYDVRLLSEGGLTGGGRGTLKVYANSLSMIGNVAQKQPSIETPGQFRLLGSSDQLSPGEFTGRLFNMRNFVWNGQGGGSAINPVAIIPMRDPVTLKNWYGTLTVTMSTGWGPENTSNLIANIQFSWARDGIPTTGILESEGFREGNGLSFLYAEMGWNSGAGYPELVLYNKTATSVRFMITGTVFDDEGGF